MNTQALQVFITFPTRETAEDVAQGLVNERLAACVQILGPVKSIYRWQGQVESANEWLCLVKTSQAVFADVVSFVKSRHSYEVPEIIALPICDGIPSYLQWLFESIRG